MSKVSELERRVADLETIVRFLAVDSPYPTNRLQRYVNADAQSFAQVAAELRATYAWIR